MRKLFNFMLFIAFIAVACFVTGCGNTDDDWNKGSITTESVLAMTIGIQQQSEPTDVRAAVTAPQSITFDDKRFDLKNIEGITAIYTGKLLKSDIDRINNTGYALMIYKGNNYQITGTIFRQAYYGAASGVQPTAAIELNYDCSVVVKAESNGKTAEKPTITPVVTPIPTPTGDKTKLDLSPSMEMITVTVPDSIGKLDTNNGYVSWKLRLTDNTTGSSITVNKGEGTDYYDEAPDGNTLYLILRTAGKRKLVAGHKYSGAVIQATVLLDDKKTIKDLDVSECHIENVIWSTK